MVNLELTEEDPQSAKQFLLLCLVDQAHRDGVPLTDIEKRMFLFSETDGETDWEANRHFEAEYNDTEYEAKIAKLLHDSYTRADNSVENLSAWRIALGAVRNLDFYGLVMIDQALIPRPQPAVQFSSGGFRQVFLKMDPVFFPAKALIVILALFLLVDPYQLGLVRADIAKLLCIALPLPAIWLIGHAEKRLSSGKIKGKSNFAR